MSYIVFRKCSYNRFLLAALSDKQASSPNIARRSSGLSAGAVVRFCFAALTTVLLCTGTIASSFGADHPNYIGMSKRELVMKLGLPAEIRLDLKSGPYPEEWVYYCEDANKELTAASVWFDQAKVSAYIPVLNPAAVVSTETPAGCNRVYAYILAQRHHGQTGRVKASPRKD
jgi:hypothetical protein